MSSSLLLGLSIPEKVIYHDIFHRFHMEHAPLKSWRKTMENSSELQADTTNAPSCGHREGPKASCNSSRRSVRSGLWSARKASGFGRGPPRCFPMGKFIGKLWANHGTTKLIKERWETMECGLMMWADCEWLWMLSMGYDWIHRKIAPIVPIWDLGTYLLEIHGYPTVRRSDSQWVSGFSIFRLSACPSTGYDHYDFPCFPLADVLWEGYVTISVVPTHNIIDTWCLYIYIYIYI